MPYKNPEDQKRNVKKWYQANKRKHIQRQKTRSREIRLQVYDYKEKYPCHDCGQYYPFYVMQFDHVRGEKVANVADLLNRNCTIVGVWTETGKCDLVCSNCHSHRTYIRRRMQSMNGAKAAVTWRALEELVLQWASDRKIVPNGKPEAQLMKTVSELGELSDATLKGDLDGIKDGVGDVLVTLIIYCKLQGISIVDCLNEAFEEIKDRKGTLTPEGIFVKESAA